MRLVASHPWIDVSIVVMYIAVIASIAAVLIADCLLLKLICASILFVIPCLCAVIVIKLNDQFDKLNRSNNRREEQ